MKLKKIMALALSGVLAVSMLAGCAGKSLSSSELTKDLLDNVSLAEGVKMTAESGSKLTELKNALKSAVDANAGTGEEVSTYVNSTKLVPIESEEGTVYGHMKKALEAGGNSIKDVATYIQPGESTASAVRVFAIGDKVSDETIVVLLNNTVAFDQLPASGEGVDYSYTLGVSIAEKANVKYAAVRVTVTAVSVGE